MIFRPELALAIVRHEKTQTRRALSDNPRSPWSSAGCRYQLHDVFAVQPGRGVPRVANARVIAPTRCEPIESITATEARMEGFADEAAFLEAFFAINPSATPRDLVWVIEFSVTSTIAKRFRELEARVEGATA